MKKIITLAIIVSVQFATQYASAQEEDSDYFWALEECLEASKVGQEKICSGRIKIFQHGTDSLRFSWDGLAAKIMWAKLKKTIEPIEEENSDHQFGRSYYIEGNDLICRRSAEVTQEPFSCEAILKVRKRVANRRQSTNIQGVFQPPVQSDHIGEEELLISGSFMAKHPSTAPKFSDRPIAVLYDAAVSSLLWDYSLVQFGFPTVNIGHTMISGLVTGGFTCTKRCLNVKATVCASKSPFAETNCSQQLGTFKFRKNREEFTQYFDGSLAGKELQKFGGPLPSMGSSN